MHAYDWVTVRAVPRVERGEFVNVGVVVYCRQLDYLGAQVDCAEDRVRALDPHLDTEVVRRHLRSLQDLCEGAPAAGANGARPPGERFRWLAAPRSTVVQTSPVHTGLTADPAAELARLFDAMVRLPGA